MLTKVEITGFEKDYYWTDTKTNTTYQFLSDGTGFLLKPNKAMENIKWEYLDDKNAIKIGYNGSIFYYIIQSKEKESLKVKFKSKSNDMDSILLRSTSKAKASKDDELSKDLELEYETEVDDSGIAVPIIKDIDKIDKITFGVLLFLIFVLVIVLLKVNMLTSSIPFFGVIFVALICTGVAYFKLKNISFFLSKKHKKKLEDIFNKVEGIVIKK
jgi:hypothetical protein